MKSLKTLVCATSFAMCFGAASMASAAVITPEGPFTNLTGSITVLSPSSSLPVTCTLTASGTVSGGIATISSATFTGGILCPLAQLKSLPNPGWVLKALTTTTGTLSNVGYVINGAPPLIPKSDCGPTNINVTWNQGTHVLGATNQTLLGQGTGNCTIQTLTVNAPGLSVQ
ncbi:alkane oxidation protein activator PraB [Pseudomonas sp. CBZ-4]|jgi:hypothetical protein|uniref:alkane oxidation protein activator PraB n=1 Tax=Pseudomonas sp. CBZ-4 TaxID=1163065 RepID=UPI0004766133|nr:alkane oxidation protein activator PraB [Pseudomonas sp. CBZ-4]